MDNLRLIKKYPNRRLYDTQTSAYITLCDIKTFVLSHTPFRVVDARSHQDLTRCILMQIILDEELGQSPLFSCDMLSQMIRAYGNDRHGFMGTYLEQALRQAIEWQQTGRLPTPTEASPPGLMGHYLTQMTQLYLAMQNQGSSIHDQAMRPVDGQYPADNQPHLSQSRAKVHPPV